MGRQFSVGVLPRGFSTFSYHRQRSQHQHRFEPRVSASIIRPILWAAAFTACAYYATTETVVYNLLKPKPPTSGDSKALNNCKVRPLTKIIGNPSAELMGALFSWLVAGDARKTDVEALSIDAIYTAAKASASSVFTAFKDQCKTNSRRIPRLRNSGAQHSGVFHVAFTAAGSTYETAFRS